MKKSKIIRKKLNKVKKNLILDQDWIKYLKKFRHHQMRLLASKIALIYNINIKVIDLLKIEKLMLDASKNKHPEMFVPIFIYLGILTKTKANWNAFGRFIFYIFQTSTFYHDSRFRKTNIFNKKNIIERNFEKREYFYSWLHSLDIAEKDFNKRIIQVQKLVF